MSVCVCVPMSLYQRLWQVCRFRAAVLLTPWSRSSLSGRQVRPSPQSQRWKSSKPWVPFLRWRVHTWPSVSTGLQMRDQKCLAQHRPSEQSADLRQASPSWPEERDGKMSSQWIRPHIFSCCLNLIITDNNNGSEDDLPFTDCGWWLWPVGGFLAWCSKVLLCLFQPVIMDASVPSMSFAWQTPLKVKRKTKTHLGLVFTTADIKSTTSGNTINDGCQ